MLKWMLDYKCVGVQRAKVAKKKKKNENGHFTEVQGMIYYGLPSTAAFL